MPMNFVQLDQHNSSGDATDTTSEVAIITAEKARDESYQKLW
jgi:hypothetical protein